MRLSRRWITQLRTKFARLRYRGKHSDVTVFRVERVHAPFAPWRFTEAVIARTSSVFHATDNKLRASKYCPFRSAGRRTVLLYYPALFIDHFYWVYK